MNSNLIHGIIKIEITVQNYAKVPQQIWIQKNLNFLLFLCSTFSV